ncbi:MAG: alternate-type signal peptide domain-containing protein [Protaetiibacter sp.]
MNKNIKASIAIAAGVVLLMGGAGSLAYWNDTQSVGANGTTITAGTLTATAGTGTWTKSFFDASGNQVGSSSTVDPGSVLIVPGNRLVYTQTFTINATGNDLYFTITPTSGAITGSGTADIALASALASSTFAVTNTAASTGTTVAPATTSGVYKVGAGSTPTTFTVTWTITWPFGTAPASNTTGDNAAKTGAVSLSAGAVTLTQVANP